MKREQSLIVGIDVGGTNLRLAAVDKNGSILDRLRMPTGCNRTEFISQLAVNITLLSEKSVQTGSRVIGVGIGMPGLISPSGEVFSSVNLPHCEGINLEKEVELLTGIPVVAVNDANAAAFGEYRFGAGRLFRTFMMITIGTGIGGGLVLDGNLWAGADGFACEFGHLTVVPDGRPCACGNYGCLEQYASATAILAMAKEKGLLGSSSADSVETLAAASVKGDVEISALFQEAGSYLGAASAAVVNLLNPEAIIVGGGVSASFSLMQDSMRKVVDERAFRPSSKRLQILKGALCDDAGVLGAAAVAFAKFG
jgi:glucokinase